MTAGCTAHRHSPQFRKALDERLRAPAYGFATPAPSGIGLQLTTLRLDSLPVNRDEMYADFILTTAHRDRVGDEVIPAGCDLTEYRGNPNVYAFHQDMPLPIGRSATPDGQLTIRILDDRITARCYFTKANDDALGVFELVAEGMLPGCSIGFDFIDEPLPLPKLKDHPHAGYRYDSWKLLEWSVVGIPCNPYAGLDRTGTAGAFLRADGDDGASASDGFYSESFAKQYRAAGQRAAGLIRKTLETGRLNGEPLSPRVLKGLQPLTERRPVMVHGGWDSVNRERDPHGNLIPLDDWSADVARWAAQLARIKTRQACAFAAMRGSLQQIDREIKSLKSNSERR